MRRIPATVIDLSALTLAGLAAFVSLAGNGFVNWDDPTVIVDNARLAWPGVFAWAFHTTLIGHYQPLAWLSFAAVHAFFGASPAPFHMMSFAGHTIDAALVYFVALQLGVASRAKLIHRRIAALAGAGLFALHPVVVEPVAWASAMPYVLSLGALLVALLAYLHDRRRLSIAAYAMSVLFRPTAIAFPIVLLLLDWYPLDRYRGTSPRRLVIEKMPFVAIAIAAATAEWIARDVATLQEVGVGARLTLAATAPFVYLGRLLLPVRLSPLDVIPISPVTAPGRLALGGAALVATTAAAWLLRRRQPAVVVSWLAYLVLLAPVIGLTPSGLQATADRYLYVPLVVVALAAGAAARQAASRWPAAVGPAIVAGVALFAALGTLTSRQIGYWHDSISLWTRAAELDPRNDVATYNLAVALAEAGRDQDAIRAYDATLRLVPDHDLARRNRSMLQATLAEREADRLAASGHLAQAEALYAQVLSLDGTREHARAAHGILLMHRGQLDEAVPELRKAFDAGVTDPEVPNALAFGLLQRGERSEAAAVLRRAFADHPGNANLEHNLKLLLAGK